MKSWQVAVPITGVCYVTVQAKDESAAISAAFDALPNTPDEWEAHSRIVQGNVFSGMQNEIEIQEE